MGTGDAERIQALTDGINKLTDRLERAGATNSNTLNNVGLGWTGIICASLAFCCLLGCGGVAWMVSVELHRQSDNAIKDEIRVDAELHDLRAWRDIDHGKILKLEAAKQ